MKILEFLSENLVFGCKIFNVFELACFRNDILLAQTCLSENFFGLFHKVFN